MSTCSARITFYKADTATFISLCTVYTHTHTTKRSYPGHFNADINTSLCHSHTTSVFLQTTINFNSMQVCGVGIKAMDVGL